MQLSLGGSLGWKEPVCNPGVLTGAAQPSHADRAAAKAIHPTADTWGQTKAPCSLCPGWEREGKKEDKALEQACKVPIKYRR